MSHTPLKILIVEDEAVLAMDVEAMVEDEGHHVIGCAASLREVEKINGDAAPDLAFVDIQLAGGSNGFDVSEYIRRRWTNTIVIFLTANPLKIPADFAGAHGVIAKPFSQNGLLSALRYLEKGILDPPPSPAQPASFQASANYVMGQ